MVRWDDEANKRGFSDIHSYIHTVYYGLQWTQRRIAEDLGCSRCTVWRKMKELNLPAKRNGVKPRTGRVLKFFEKNWMHLSNLTAREIADRARIDYHKVYQYLRKCRIDYRRLKCTK